MDAITSPRVPSTVPAIIPAIPPPGDKPGRWLPAGWDGRDFRELALSEKSPGTARKLIKARVPEWGLGEVCYTVELVATELLTNSIAATRECGWQGDAPGVQFWLLGGDEGVAVIVRDEVPWAPQRQHPGEHDTSGRGVGIVREVSAESGFYFPAHPWRGKVTWAIIR